MQLNIQKGWLEIQDGNHIKNNKHLNYKCKCLNKSIEKKKRII